MAATTRSAATIISMKREAEPQSLEPSLLQFFLVAQEIMEQASGLDDLAWHETASRVRKLMQADREMYVMLITNKALWEKLLAKLVRERDVPLHLPLPSVDAMSVREMTQLLCHTKTHEHVYRYCFAPVLQTAIMRRVTPDVLPPGGSVLTHMNELFWGATLSPLLEAALLCYGNDRVLDEETQLLVRPHDEWSDEKKADTLHWLLDTDFLRNLEQYASILKRAPKEAYELAHLYVWESDQKKADAMAEFNAIFETVMERVVTDAASIAVMREEITTLLRNTLHHEVNALQEPDNESTIVARADLPFAYRLFWYLADRYETRRYTNRRPGRENVHQMFHAPHRACLQCGARDAPLLREATPEGAYFCTTECQEKCRHK